MIQISAVASSLYADGLDALCHCVVHQYIMKTFMFSPHFVVVDIKHFTNNNNKKIIYTNDLIPF